MFSRTIKIIFCCSCFNASKSYTKSAAEVTTKSVELSQPQKSINEDKKVFSDNVYFYKNELRSRPDHKLIEEIHKEWFRDYYTLESKHGYIQWLFPLFERGVNWDCPPLKKEDVCELLKDEKAMNRLIVSLKLMLDFYGMRLDEEKMIVYDNENSKSRYDHLNHSYHNYLRISRILTCLEIFEKHDYALAFLRHLYWECFIDENLINAQDSCERFWITRVNGCKDWSSKSNDEIVKMLEDEYHHSKKYHGNEELRNFQNNDRNKKNSKNEKEDEEKNSFVTSNLYRKNNQQKEQHTKNGGDYVECKDENKITSKESKEESKEASISTKLENEKDKSKEDENDLYNNNFNNNVEL